MVAVAHDLYKQMLAHHTITVHVMHDVELFNRPPPPKKKPYIKGTQCTTLFLFTVFKTMIYNL
jgi:hypothetical protein